MERYILLTARGHGCILGRGVHLHVMLGFKFKDQVCDNALHPEDGTEEIL